MADINDIKNRTVSHGTLNPDHLIPAFCDVLKEYAPDKYAEFIKDYPELDGWEEFLRDDWRLVSDDTKVDACDALFGLLNDIAPEGTLFSSTEGDGSDFGFWSVDEKLLGDDEGEKALKQMAKNGKSTGEVAADIRYDVATALDMAADKAEDLMSKFGLDKIYVLRAKGLSPKAIAKKILKASESKTEAALRPWRTDFEKDLQKRIDDAKGTKYDTQDFIADGWEFVTGDVHDDGSDAGKDVAVAFFKREQDGQDYRMWLAFDPDTKEITGGKWWIESNESKDERRDNADYLQEVWDALVPVWDKEKFNMDKGYDDEYECEAITIVSKNNEGVRAKIYVDDHEGKHPVGFNVIYRYPGDKGVGDLGYYEFQSTDFDEVAPEIFAYFDELKGKVGEAKDKFVVGMMISLDGVKQYIREIKPRTFVGQSVDTGKEFTLPLASLNRANVLFDPRTSEKQSEAKGDNWVAYYFCEDPQGMEWAVLPHAITGIGSARCVNARGGDDSISIKYVLDKCSPIKDVKGSGIYGKVKELEDRDIVALTRDEAERIALAGNRLEMLKSVVDVKDESCKSEATGVAAIYGDGDVSTHENSADGFYVDEHDPMGFAVLNNDTATMKELFSGKAAAPEKPWTYAGWHEDTDAPENKDGSYPYVYDWEREYDLNFVNDWKRVVGDKNNEKALELLLKYAPDFIPSAMDFWNAFHAGYSKGLLRKLFDNIFAVVDKDDPDNNYLGYGDYTYDEVADFLDGKDEAADSRRVDDYANMRFFDPEEFVKYVRKAYGKDGGYVSIDSVVPVSVLDKANRMAQKNGYKKMEAKKAISCNALIAALQEKGFDVKEDLNGSYRIVAKGDNFDTTDNLLFITTLYPESTSDRDFVSDSAFVRGRVNGNRIVATDLKSVEDIVSVCVDAFGKKTETKNEDLNTAKDFVYSIAPIGILVRQATQPGFKDAKNSDDHIIVGFMHHDNTRFIIDWDADKKQGTATRQVMADDKDALYGYKWVTPKNNANVTFTTREELKDFVEGSWDNTSSESKNESLTLKQKELKDMARYGEAEDITTISDAEAKELKKKGIETVGVSRGTYGMNGALLRDREGNKYVITARSSNLFYFV